MDEAVVVVSSWSVMRQVPLRREQAKPAPQVCSQREAVRGRSRAFVSARRVTQGRSVVAGRASRACRPVCRSSVVVQEDGAESESGGRLVLIIDGSCSLDTLEGVRKKRLGRGRGGEGKAGAAAGTPLARVAVRTSQSPNHPVAGLRSEWAGRLRHYCEPTASSVPSDIAALCALPDQLSTMLPFCRFLNVLVERD